MLSNGDSRTPIFIQEPNDHYYIVKNQPINITCKAIFAVRIGYRCAGQWQLHERMRVEVDPKSGVKVLTSTLEVTREEVKEYYGGNDFWCECHAHTSPKIAQEEGQVVSTKGMVEVACKFIFIEGYSQCQQTGSVILQNYHRCDIKHIIMLP